MDRIKRQVPFLRAIVSASERNRRRDLLKHANKDQINAISEITLNLLRNNIPVSPITMAKLRPFRNTLRRIGKRSVSLKKRRQALINQKGGRFWSGLGTIVKNCC